MGRNGSGIAARGNAIQITFSFEGKTHRKTVKVGGKSLPATTSNLKFAQRLLNEIREKIRHDAFVFSDYFEAGGDVGPTTVGGYLWAWLDRQDVTPSTVKAYGSAIRFWERTKTGTPAFSVAERPLKALRFSHIDEAKARNPQIVGRTFNGYLMVLDSALNDAVKDKIITENPAALVEQAKVVADDPDPFTPAERETIIAEFKKRLPGQTANLIEFWFWTGLRSGELIQLQWQNVDLAKRTMTISESKVLGKVKTTKTGRSRTVPLNSIAIAVLERQKAWTFLKGKEVFQHPELRKAWSSSTVLHHSWERVVRPIRTVRYRSCYNCRHTFATALLMAPDRINYAWCAKVMGHSVQVFLTTYARWVEGQRDTEEAAKLEASIGSGTAQEMHKISANS